MNIRERHHLIKPAIGVHPREQESYDLATSLLCAAPCVVIISAILDQLLITIYMNWIHPWRGIVENKTDPMADQAEPNDPGNLQNAIQDMIPLLKLNLAQSESNQGDQITEPTVVAHSTIEKE